MADSTGGQRGHQGHMSEDSPLARRRARKEEQPEGPWAPGQETAPGELVAHGLCLVLCQMTSELGEWGAAWPAWTAPRRALSRRCAPHESTAHTAPRSGRPGAYPYWASRGASSCCLAAPDDRGEREREHSQRAQAQGRGAWVPGAMCPASCPAGLTVHPVVLLIAPLAQDGG